MFQKIDPNKLLFLDIETVSEKATFDQLYDTGKDLFAAKTQYQRTEDQSPASFYERAGIWAEFGKIVCISVGFFNTLHLWRFGDYKHYTSLSLLAHVLGIPTLKDDIDASQVARVFYEEKNIDRIVIYCEKDVITIAQVVLRLRNQSLLQPQEIQHS